MCKSRYCYAACLCLVGYEHLEPCADFYIWEKAQLASGGDVRYESYPCLGCEDWQTSKVSDKICFKCKSEQLRLQKHYADVLLDERIDKYGVNVGMK